MTRAARNILRDALSLDEGERAALASLLLESLDVSAEENVEESWRDEVDRRVNQLSAGQVMTEPWDGVRTRLLQTARGTSDG